MSLAYAETIQLPLTPRQMEVLKLASEGKGNQEIADELFLSIRTVENNISFIINRLNPPENAHARVFIVLWFLEFNNLLIPNREITITMFPEEIVVLHPQYMLRD